MSSRANHIDNLLARLGVPPATFHFLVCFAACKLQVAGRRSLMLGANFKVKSPAEFDGPKVDHLLRADQ